MAPTKGKTGSSKAKTGSSKGQNKRSQKPSSNRKAPAPSAAPKQKSKVVKKTAPLKPKQKKRRIYTEAELNIPKLNTITPAGVHKPKGKKKGKVFVDDHDSMMTIMAMVNADKEGQIESKMMRARQMEEIRQARIAETEARAESKKQKLEDTKDELRKKKSAPKTKFTAQDNTASAKSTMKRVSFG